MIKFLPLLVFLTLNSTVLSQNSKAEKILQEGKLLYRLERASWIATDHFLATYSEKTDSIGGYLSYCSSDTSVRTIFFSRSDKFYVLARYEFDSIPSENSFIVNTIIHSPMGPEKDLITIRQNAINDIFNNEDNFITFYENTSLNPIPLIDGTQKQVFILTSTHETGKILLGNDYIFTFSQDNEILKKEKLHNSLITFPYSVDKDGQEIKSTIHSHILTDFITSTDICTLFLYKHFLTWDTHYVISKKYVSILNLANETLTVMKTKDFKKIGKKN